MSEEQASPSSPSMLDRIRGSLLGGAVGDALGAGIEFLNLHEIRDLFGELGIQNYSEAYGRKGAITDDTQMTLFTAEGLLRAWVRSCLKGICHTPSIVHHAYLRWLLTQHERPASKTCKIDTDGWLYKVRGLHHRRAPGNTCLGALRAAWEIGIPEIADNDSKGCGAVMRMAPVGLVATRWGDDEAVFQLAGELSQLTHGHLASTLSSGYLAVVIAALLRGQSLAQALDSAGIVLHRHDQTNIVTRAIGSARELASKGRPTPESIQGLGGGWVAEEALAIAVCSALSARDFEDGILLAVNHSGDSDSTGSICGNILGAVYGVAAIPNRWLKALELRSVIERVATDIDGVLSGRRSAEELAADYPGH